MTKTTSPSLPTTYVGIDVSKDHLDACRKSGDQDPGDQNLGNQSPKEQRDARRFPNTPAGHRRLLGWLATSSSGKVQAVVESTGRYSLDLTLALYEADDTEVMVANPKALRGFAKAQMRRTKTDAVDAAVIADYTRRMSFSPWEPPPEATRELRAIARRIQALTVERTREKNRLQSLTDSRSASSVVENDIEVNIRHLKRRINELLRQAMACVNSSEPLTKAYGHLTSVRGIAEKSAVLLLGELAMLPSDMSVREWVAHAGLDPKKWESGTSVNAPERISKIGNARIRRALYMPAHSAIRYEPRVGAFYEKLLRRGKAKMVAVVAVMRKLLHAIYGMLKHGQDFDGEKFYATPETAPSTP
ncbi:IS110 family transposase [Salinibacter ruber]|uniref:IS110 family transposase n=1 Tax=Salinibacter ruber TaxID=146919 RepID=UPI0016130AB4|nr:IS110 family transposase [Salinibacter ruber]MBB4090964.1 transposase [Salinibacter ruber]